MGIELDITKELATVCATLTELSSLSTIINNHINNGDFGQRFNKMVEDIAKSYDVVTANLLPLSELDTEASFVTSFDGRHAAYTDCYLKEISKPRSYADDAYEEYLVLQTLKESKTSFPILKRSFVRLDGFIDKWITNDAWLAMGIDNLFKRLQTLLNEIAALKTKDPEDAYLIYNAAFSGFNAYLALIREKRGLLRAGKEQT
jgi:hypothetical protein